MTLEEALVEETAEEKAMFARMSAEQLKDPNLLAEVMEEEEFFRSIGIQHGD